MTIFALDTSSLAAGCALLRDGALLGEYFVNVGHTHSETAMPMARSLLAVTGTPVEEIDLFAVSAGPGSFTGLRIGVAAAKGLALGAGKPCAPVSTLESLAENVAALAFTGVIAAVMDARRDQVYCALFRSEGDHYYRVTEDAALSLGKLREFLLLDADAPVMLVGDGAVLAKNAMADLGRLRLAPPALLHQRAASVAAVAARLDPARYQSAGELAPLYLRLPQAERERLARLDNHRSNTSVSPAEGGGNTQSQKECAL